VNAGLEATSGEDAADLARLKLQFHRPPVVLVTLGKGDATGGQCRFGAEFAGILERFPADMSRNGFTRAC